MRSFVQYGRFFMVVAAAVLLNPLSAAAQSITEARTWTLTPFVSGAFGTSENLGSSLGVGVGVTYDLTTHLGIEGEFGHVFDVLGDNENIDQSLNTVSGNAVYNFSVPRVTPYATFGLGFERSSIDVKNPDPAALYPPSSTEVLYNFGGGLKYPVSDEFLLRADLRRFQANDLAPDHWRLYGGLTWWIKR